MNYLLNITLFDIFISFFIYINTLTVFIFPLKDYKREIECEKKNNIDNRNLYIFKTIIIIIWIFILIILAIYLGFKYNFISFISLFLYLSFLWFAFKIRKKNISEFTYENKMYYIVTTILYSMFFSSKASSIYLDTFSYLPRIVKEYMLITFLIIKLVFFVFCIIINLSILLSNIKNIFKK